MVTYNTLPCARVTYPENHGTLYEQWRTEQDGRLHGSCIGWLPRIPCARVIYQENHRTPYEQWERSKAAGCMVLVLDGFLPNLARETARKTSGTLHEQVDWFSCKMVTYSTLRKSNLSRKPLNTVRTMKNGVSRQVSWFWYWMVSYMIPCARNCQETPRNTLRTSWLVLV